MRMLFAAAVAACLLIASPLLLVTLFLLSRIVTGVDFWRRTSDLYTTNLASFHSPHSLTWSWALSFIRPRSADEGRWLGLHGYRTNTGWTVFLQVARRQLHLSRQYPMPYRTLYRRMRDRRHGPEAAVPLPDGRRIPVDLRTGGRLATLLMIAALPINIIGCTTTDPITGETIAVRDVQSAARVACRFLPTAETVADIIATDDPRLATASAIARAICAALDLQTPAGIMTLYKPAPTVNGVVIRGERV